MKFLESLMQFIMNFLRSPFQFGSSDQPSRNSRSGSPTVENMFIDPTTGLTTDSKWKAASPGVGASSSIAGSPRLQHRVPGFENNGNHSVDLSQQPSVPPDASNEDCENSQRVRVVPIKVESVDDSGTYRKKTGPFHSNSGSIPWSNQMGPVHPFCEDLTSRKRHSSGPAIHRKSDGSESKPKVCNIPIFVEGRDTPVVPKTQSSQNVPVSNMQSPNAQSAAAKQNGGNLVKCSTKSKGKQEEKLNARDISLKQISDVLSELQSLKTVVCEFRGGPQDKQYRYLDEMLTRCMLKLDNVETHGDEEVRASRKAAVKAVQKCINDLESSAQTNAKLDQLSERAGGTGEKCDTFDVGATQKKESGVPKVEAELPVNENIQETTKSFNKAEGYEDSSAVNKQVSIKEIEDIQQEHILTSNVGCPEMSVTQDESKNLEEVGNTVNNPMGVGEIKTVADKPEKLDEKVQKETEDTYREQPCSTKAADVLTSNVGLEPKESQTPTGELEKSKEKALVQDKFDVVEECEGMVETGNDTSDSVEMSHTPSSRSAIPGDLPEPGEPIDSDESKIDSEMVEVKDAPVDSEMVALAKEPVSVESNKDSSGSLETKD